MEWVRDALPLYPALCNSLSRENPEEPSETVEKNLPRQKPPGYPEHPTTPFLFSWPQIMRPGARMIR